MARGKKNENVLTLEEKLAQALVPDWEKPYKVPKNWCFFYFTSLIDIEGGTQPPKSQFIEEPKDGYVRLIQIRDFATDRYTVYVPDTPKMRHLEKKDILIARYGASLGRICTGQQGVYNVALAKTIFSESALYRKYVYWMLQSETFQNPLTQLSRIAQAGFNKDDLSGFAMPLAPLSEQKRIVDRIEYMFAKLDEAKEKAQAVLDSFEIRKAAILHKAFAGELSAKWRAEQDIGMTSWKNTTLAQVVSGFKYGTSEKSDYNNTGMPVLRIPNVGDSSVDFSDMKYLAHTDVDEESQIHEGDILIIRSNGSRDLVGKSVLIPKLDRSYAYASFLIRIKPSDIVKADYLTMYLNSADARSQMFRKAKSSAGINNINSKELGAISLMLPSISEQMEIVRILDSLFAKEQQAKEAAEAVLEKIDLLKKSILARAFRGELGTNDPTEQSAIELLKEVLQENKTPVPRKRAKSMPKDLQAQLTTALERKIIKMYFQQDTDSLPVKELLSIETKKFEIMEALRNLEQSGIIKKLPNGNYRLLW